MTKVALQQAPAVPADDIPALFLSLGIALGLGLLVGLQRERSGSALGGIRTFPLIALLGGLAALLGASFGGWMVAAGLGGVIAVIVAGNLLARARGDRDPGMTTEVAMLVVFLVGAVAVRGPIEVAVAVGGCLMVLLHVKEGLHRLARRLSDRDVAAIVQFVLITLVILPVLPDRTFGPYDVLNPRTIWLMVVLVVGINLGGYVAFKFLGARGGVLVGGILGGLISSTATTVSAARRARVVPHPLSLALLVAVASTTVMPRLVAVIAVVAPTAWLALAAPLGVVFAVQALWASGALWRARAQTVEVPEPENPTELKAAIVFSLIFAVVLVAVAWARETLGDRGLFAVATASGLTDVDAITISSARLVGDGRLAVATGGRAILIAILANTVFKVGTAGFLGGVRMLSWTALLTAPTFVTGALLLVWWPFATTS